MNQDIGPSAHVYGLAVGAFFRGYCLLEVPSNLILEKVGARPWITRILGRRTSVSSQVCIRVARSEKLPTVPP